MKKIINKYNTFFKYVISSGICLVLDLSLFTLFNYLLKDNLGVLSITVSVVLARIISSVLNYFLNRNKVFKTDNNKFDTTTFIEYVFLVITQIIVSSVTITLLYEHIHINETIIKFVVDVVLFVVNFIVQKYYIFNKEFKKKNNYILLLYSLLSTFAILVNPINTDALLKIDIQSKIIPLTIVFIALYKLYKKYYNDIKYYKPFGILTIIFTLLLIFGYSFDTCDSSILVYGDIQYIALSIVKFFGYFIFINFILNFVYEWIIKLELKEYTSKKLKKYLEYFTTHPFKATFIVLLVIYSIYFIAYYPGIFGYDPSYQIQEYMHIPTFYTPSSNITTNSLITQFNPVMHTLLIGFMFSIGHAIGYDNLGLALYTLIQMLSFIVVLSYTIKVMFEEKVNNKLIIGCLIIYAFVPLFAFYSLSTFKDTYYATFFILFIVQLYKVIKYKMSYKNIFILILVSVGLCAFRHNGYLTIVITLLLSILSLKQNRKQLLLALIFITLIHYSYKQVLNYFEVPATSVREVLSVPLQQTAALIVNKEDVIEEEDKIVIDKIIDYSIVKEKYNPELSDPIKNTYRNEATNEDLMNYIKVWFKYLTKEPKIYIEATINNVYGYFYPEKQQWYFYYKKYKVLNDSGFDYHYINILNPLRIFLSSYGFAYQYVPVLNLTTSIGLTTWVYLYLMVILFRNKKNKYVLLLIPAFLTIAMCMVGPVNSYYRYVIPYSMSLPFILSVLYKEIKNKIN